ncbi:MAG: sarcosine oxidase subunit delta [Burkholderiaceae bacterium]
MASLINCPHCGQRATEEFTPRGQVPPPRPSPDDPPGVWSDYVHLRTNPKGRLKEHWHHTGGCRRWLVVTRDTTTHEVFEVQDAAGLS